MVTFGENFGNKFVNQGSFGKKAKKKIKKAGFDNVQGFLDASGIDRDNAPGSVLDFQQAALAANPNINIENFQEPTVQPQAPTAAPVTPAPPVTSTGSVGAQAVGQAQAGAGLLNGVDLSGLIDLSREQFEIAQANRAAAQEQVNAFLGKAEAPTLSDAFLQKLENDRASRLSEIETLFDPGSDRFRQFQAELGDIDAVNSQLGLFDSSTSAGQRGSAVRGIARDENNALIAANELFRNQELSELDKSRQQSLAAAQLVGQLGGQDLAAASGFLNNALSGGTAGAQLGSGLLQSGIQNQLGSILTDAQLQQLEFQSIIDAINTVNQGRQQATENIEADKINDALLDQILNPPDTGGGFLGGIFGF